MCGVKELTRPLVVVADNSGHRSRLGDGDGDGGSRTHTASRQVTATQTIAPVGVELPQRKRTGRTKEVVGRRTMRKTQGSVCRSFEGSFWLCFWLLVGKPVQAKGTRKGTKRERWRTGRRGWEGWNGGVAVSRGKKATNTNHQPSQDQARGRERGEKGEQIGAHDEKDRRGKEGSRKIGRRGERGGRGGGRGGGGGGAGVCSDVVCV